MKLIIDIGNTRCKWAIFDGKKLIETHFADEFDPELVAHIISEHREITDAILSSVREIRTESRDMLVEHSDYLIELNHHTPTPIVNKYKSPETLGLDRLAAAIGAASFFPDQALLVIDAGTAITIDIINRSNEYLGGNISPGIETRFKALHQFTGKLPLVHLQDDFQTIGENTESAIRAGVQQGVIYELQSYIDHYQNEYKAIETVLTGGHASFLFKHFGSQVKLIDNLTLIGLNEILDFNIDRY